MAATELARILYAVNKILEDSSSAIGLSKRAALALTLIDMEPNQNVNGRSVVSNKGLREKFILHRISESVSAKKDASSAKGELLESNYIEIVGKVSVFALTPVGKMKANELYASMNSAVETAGLSDDERALLRKLCGLTPSLRTDGTIQRKASTSERGAAQKEISKFN